MKGFAIAPASGKLEKKAVSPLQRGDETIICCGKAQKSPEPLWFGACFLLRCRETPCRGTASRAARPAIDPYKSFRGIGEGGAGRGKGALFQKGGAFPPQLLVGTYFKLHKINIELLL